MRANRNHRVGGGIDPDAVIGELEILLRPNGGHVARDTRSSGNGRGVARRGVAFRALRIIASWLVLHCTVR